ncbi:7SK snRNA methylphosphate capping enzyme [Salminus brasiliensis]|uniref:7SK snRNA methylphosphate capping enzyme n=1 Tax=Salminus brasiliensis TaxID=930266 RepID=UPI003B8391BB
MIEMSVDDKRETVFPSERPEDASLPPPPQRHSQVFDKRTETTEDPGQAAPDSSVQQPKPQPRLNKRRSTMSSGFKHPVFGKRRRRATSESESVLPTNFLLGGNIFDPLNLNSLLDEEVNRALNAETPKSSPLPAKNRDPVEILIPRDITDPLNLNCCVTGDGGLLLTPLKSGGGGRRRHRNRHHGVTGVGGSGRGGEGAVTRLGDLSESEKGKTCPASQTEVAVTSSGPRLDCVASEAPEKEALESGSIPTQEAQCPSAPDSTGGREEKDEMAASAPVLENSNPTPASHRQRKRKRTTSKSENFGAPYWDKSRASDLQAQQQQQQPNHRRHQKNQQKPNQQKKKFQYGNYDKYYGYRNPGLTEDPRMHTLKPEWFRGKEVLDLGCNTGRLTLSIAKTWQPSRIVGLDIDGSLIHAARKNILYFLSEMHVLKARSGKKDEGGGKEKEPEKVAEEPENKDKSGGSLELEERKEGVKGAEEKEEEVVEEEERALEAGSNAMVDRSEDGDARKPDGGEASSSNGSYLFPVSLCISRGPIAAPPLPDTRPPSPGNFPANVSFVKGNYVLDSDLLLLTQREEFDVILCLSVTKWIHLNWGDDGLKRLFQRVYRHLRPGGLFILEPQPWHSYGKRKKLTETITKNYYSIRLKPEQFSTYLTNEGGFSSYELIGTPNNLSRGFQRPIYLFHKGPAPRK